MNDYLYEQLQIGMTASFCKELTLEMENSFRQITGDENPLHKDDHFAKEVSGGKFQSHAVFGMLTASLCSTMAGMYLPGKYSLIHSFDELSFLKPVFAGDLLTVKGEIADKNDSLKLLRLNVTIKNQNNKTVSRAKMKVLVLR